MFLGMLPYRKDYVLGLHKFMRHSSLPHGQGLFSEAHTCVAFERVWACLRLPLASRAHIDAEPGLPVHDNHEVAQAIHRAISPCYDIYSFFRIKFQLPVWSLSTNDLSSCQLT